MTGIASSVVWQVPLEGRGSWFVLESLWCRVHYCWLAFRLRNVWRVCHHTAADLLTWESRNINSISSLSWMQFIDREFSKRWVGRYSLCQTSHPEYHCLSCRVPYCPPHQVLTSCSLQGQFFFSLWGLFSVVLDSQASKHRRDSNCDWLLLGCYYWPIPCLLPAQTCFSLCQIDPTSSFMQNPIPDRSSSSACVGQDLLLDEQTVKTHQGCVLRICFLPNIWETFIASEWYFSNSCFVLLLSFTLLLGKTP